MLRIQEHLKDRQSPFQHVYLTGVMRLKMQQSTHFNVSTKPVQALESSQLQQY